MKAKSQKITDLEIVPPTYDNVHPDFAAIRAAVKKATATSAAAAAK